MIPKINGLFTPASVGTSLIMPASNNERVLSRLAALAPTSSNLEVAAEVKKTKVRVRVTSPNPKLERISTARFSEVTLPQATIPAPIEEKTATHISISKETLVNRISEHSESLNNNSNILYPRGFLEKFRSGSKKHRQLFSKRAKDGYIEAKGLERTKPLTFKLCRGAKPSEVLDNITKNPFCKACIDCAIAIQLVFLLGLKDIMGPIYFDNIMTRISQDVPLLDSENASLLPFVEVLELEQKADIKPGDMCYIGNAYDYQLHVEKESNRIMQGYHLSVDNEGKFHGFKFTPRTQDEVEEYLRENYNEVLTSSPKVTKEEFDLLPTLFIAKDDKISKLESPHPLGKLDKFVLRPNMKAIQKFCTLDPEKIEGALKDSKHYQKTMKFFKMRDGLIIGPH